MNKPYLRCHQCRELKRAEEFAVKASNKTGRRGICLACNPSSPSPKVDRVPAVVRERMCETKRRYRTRGAAVRAALRSAKRTPTMRFYLCPLCRGWHLTSKPAKEGVR